MNRPSRDTLQHFGDVTPAQFLRDYWQQKPLFVKNSMPEPATLLDGDDLAGLALEEHVESRIVLQHDDGRWELRRGPFTEKTFQTLPEKNWTLLIQAVDHYLPELAELLECFNFLPNWRIDDVMVSYAVDGGSVGPHYDSYDVFLIQGKGTRRWKIGSPATDRDLLPHPDLRILAKMNMTEEFVCEPGDLLYLPPQLSHWGVAQGECMTYSVGFRMPSDRELLDNFCSAIVDAIPEQQRHGDVGIKPAAHPGELTAHAIKTLRGRINDLIQEPGALEDFLGRALSEPKYQNHAPDMPAKLWTKSTLAQALTKTSVVRRDEASRFLLLPDTLTPAFYVNGERLAPGSDGTWLQAATLIADHRLIDPLSLRKLLDDKQAATLILQLFNNGHLYLPENS